MTASSGINPPERISPQRISSQPTTPEPSASDPSQTPRLSRLRTRWRAWWWLLLVPLLAVPVVLAAKGSEQPEQVEAAQSLPVETMRLQAADSYTASRTYSGEIVARRSSELGFERSGTVIALLVDEGDDVAAGAPLARLDTRDLAAQRSQLEAQKRQVLAQLDELQAGPRREDIAAAEGAVSDLNNQLSLATLQADRRAELFSQGAISEEELDEKRFGANAIADRLQQAQSQLEELRNGTRQEQLTAQVAQVDQIDARLQAIDVSLDKSVLLAPFAGKVATRLVDEGTVVNGSQQVMKLVENGAVEARIGVPEPVAQRMAIGDRTAVTVSDRAFPATVTAKLPEVDDASQTVTMVLELDPDSGLTIGATARLSVAQQQSASGYWLPSTALVSGEQGLWSVYVLTQEDVADETADDTANTYRVARRDVEVLHTESEASLTDGVSGNRAFVRGLVAEGDRVITSGTHRIVANQLVTPKSPVEFPSESSSEPSSNKPSDILSGEAAK
ncbi:MAG: HlyD family efflux transporter periplasmic adaptor subunit [Cyanobacteria bacterium P01_A01_bin.116]